MNRIIIYKIQEKITVHSFYMLLILFIFFSLYSCITPFEPEIDEGVQYLNIDGSIVKGRDIQKIVVSRSTSINERSFNPVEGCNVVVIDDTGVRFEFTDDEKGVYTAEINDNDLQFNKSYKLQVTTPSGDVYESQYEKLNENPPVDSVYYITETKYSIEDDEDIKGLQFYIDLKASENEPRYYRWNIVETWEYHARYPIDKYFDGENVYWFPNYDSLYYCYSTDGVDGLFSSSTINLQKNEKKKIHLHFVSGNTTKLSVKYSILVRQYSLSEGAYNYWNQKKIDLMESNGMYTTQPAQSISNFKNINNPNEIILGYFWASSETQKRIFFRGPFEGYFKWGCELDTFKIEEYWERNIIVYIQYDPILSINYTTDNYCFDCRESGGSIEKPDFWDNDEQ